MPSDELIKSWKRTERFLLDARAHVSEAAEGICADELHEFAEYIEHNELELALDALEDTFTKSQVESWHVMELMALAAASMGLAERQVRYDSTLSKARGWEYKTVLPE